MYRNRLKFDESHNADGLAAGTAKVSEVSIGDERIRAPRHLTTSLLADSGRGLPGGRIRPVGRSPDQEFNARPGNLRELPKAVEIALMSGRVTVTVTRAGITFKPDLLNSTGAVKKLTYWHLNAKVCQPSWVGRRVIAAYDRFDPSFIHVLDEDGRWIEPLPLKDKAIWFDPESTGKAIADVKKAASRVHDTLQLLHQDDSERSADAAQANQGKLDKLVHTFPSKARKTTGAGDALERAHAACKAQKAAHDRQEAEIARRIQHEGQGAVDILLDRIPQDEHGDFALSPDDAREAIEGIL